MVAYHTLHWIKLLINQRLKPQEPNSKNQDLFRDTFWNLGLEIWVLGLNESGNLSRL